MHPPGDYRCMSELADGKTATWTGHAESVTDALAKAFEAGDVVRVRLHVLRWHRGHKQYRRLMSKRLCSLIARKFGVHCQRGRDPFGGACLLIAPSPPSPFPA